MSDNKVCGSCAFYPQLRKWTVPVHWAFGLFCAFVLWQFAPAGIALLLIFAGMQVWNDKEEKAHNPGYLPTGCRDFWDSVVTFCPAVGTEVLLDMLQIITIRWWI